MHKDRALRILRAHKSELTVEHHVKSLALFGSVARDVAAQLFSERKQLDSTSN